MAAPTPPQEILIDVRSSLEYSTGYLSLNPSVPAQQIAAINIEYQVIDQIPDVLSAREVPLNKSSSITLYCRSGRRSNIALQTLRGLGYTNVRDIGGLEEARSTLMKEEIFRELEIAQEEKSKEDDPVVVDTEELSEKKMAREKGFGSLLAGLKALE